jgi:excinuclease ABC subunit A
LEQAGSLTADYVTGKRRIAAPAARRGRNQKRLVLTGADLNNLKEIKVEIPCGLFVAVTGVSGSGKSSLVMDTLAPSIEARLAGRKRLPGLKSLKGGNAFAKCIIVDQSAIGTSPRSNPASYIGILDDMRRIISQAPLAKMRGYAPGRFSFNLSEGRCAACDGRGSIKVEMHFLPDVWVTCETCRGSRFNRQTLEVEYRGKSIADMLEMEVSEAREFFANHKRVARSLALLDDVGLGYMKLGQASTTLSGGEAQRIKLARELSARAPGKTLYLLDEPTTGLHFEDVSRLVQVLHRLVDAGHTVVVIEHNEDLIWSADWIIDLGPEGGAGGGEVVFAGTPEQLVAEPASHTGRHLRKVMKRALTGMKGRSSGGRSVGLETVS